MVKKTNQVWILLIGIILAVGCQDSMTNIESETNANKQDIATSSTDSGELESLNTCQDTGIGLTAHYINEVPDSPLDITCDIGVFFDEDGNIEEAQLNATVDGAKSRQYGFYVYGANVNLKDSFVNTAADYPHQFVPVVYINGATGNVTSNELTGAHRAGILLRGSDTNVNVDGNEVIGIGPKSTGWAQNGIQVDSEASGVIKNNHVEGHFWNLDNFVSTGIGIYSNNVNARRNVVRNNDLGVLLWGDRINLDHNTVEITFSVIDINNTFGVFANPGTNIGIKQNTIMSNTGAGYGLWVFGTDNAKLIRNDVSGWQYNLIDQGDNTKLPKPFKVD